MSNLNEAKDLATAVVATDGDVVTPQADTRPGIAVAVPPPEVFGGFQDRVSGTSSLLNRRLAGSHGLFPPIADYGFLSDCQFTALVASSGNVEWMCLPRPDSPSVFGALLDRAAGGFRVGPRDVIVPAGRRYVPGTNILETTWQTRTGWLIVTDFLSIGPWCQTETRSRTHRRAPTDHDSEHTLVRIARCVHGTVDVAIGCEPVFDYGRADATWAYDGPGYSSVVAAAPGTALRVRLQTDLRLGVGGRQVSARTTLRAGEQAYVAFSWSDHGAPREWLFSCEDANAALERTAEFWRRWLDSGCFPDHPWRAHLQRSALVLKGLTYAPTGALLAAATTSLPEAPGGKRNWDYRYSWIRDSAFALWGLDSLGFEEEANDFFSFISDACQGRDGEGADLQVMYGVGGERELDERVLEHLSGYEHSGPVRVGNIAYTQNQHDVWGTMLDSVYLHTKSRDYLPERIWRIVIRQVEAALANWRRPDRGIWEVRGKTQHFTASKLMCWVAADRGARLAQLRQDVAHAARWGAAAREIHADICANGVNAEGVFTQYYGSTSLDAALLLMPLFRFLPPEDSRIQTTVLTIADKLTVDGLVLRYDAHKTDDGLPGGENTFLACSFWLVSALVEIGKTERAWNLCAELLSYASPLQLYAEEIDPRSRQHYGNFPQAFTHLALINATMALIAMDNSTVSGY
jgi:GH15 family glucan-1,4-alpha-glucosidase